jgi:hypothetical protein
VLAICQAGIQPLGSDLGTGNVAYGRLPMPGDEAQIERCVEDLADRVVGFRNSNVMPDLVVLVDQAAEAVPPPNAGGCPRWP